FLCGIGFCGAGEDGEIPVVMIIRRHQLCFQGELTEEEGREVNGGDFLPCGKIELFDMERELLPCAVSMLPGDCHEPESGAGQAQGRYVDFGVWGKVVNERIGADH